MHKGYGKKSDSPSSDDNELDVQPQEIEQSVSEAELLSNVQSNYDEADVRFLPLIEAYLAVPEEEKSIAKDMADHLSALNLSSNT